MASRVMPLSSDKSMINESALKQLVDSLTVPQDVGQIIRARPVRGLHVEWVLELLGEARKRKLVESFRGIDGYIKYRKVST